ncbi:MAG: regulatory protein RecX [Arenimonas sp.]
MAGWGKKKDSSEPSAYQRALGLLVRREHSRKELGRKLSAKGVEREDADLALDKLNKQDFQNDARFAAALARSRASAGYGPSRIRAELGTHALSRDDIAEALEACDRDWDASARDIIARRYGNKDLADPALRRKAVDFLLRRGFEQKSAFAAVRARPEGDDFAD